MVSKVDALICVPMSNIWGFWLSCIFCWDRSQPSLHSKTLTQKKDEEEGHWLIKARWKELGNKLHVRGNGRTVKVRVCWEDICNLFELLPSLFFWLTFIAEDICNVLCHFTKPFSWWNIPSHLRNSQESWNLTHSCHYFQKEIVYLGWWAWADGPGWLPCFSYLQHVFQGKQRCLSFQLVVRFILCFKELLFKRVRS